MPPVGPAPSVFLRPATAHDLGFLADVVVVAGRASGRLAADFDERAFRARFVTDLLDEVEGRAAHRETSVIHIDGERAGRHAVVRAPGHWELVGIQLLPAHQGHGLGTHLIEQFLVEARDARMPARLRVERDNPRARGLYERLGCVLVAGGADHADDTGHPGHPGGDLVLEWVGEATTWAGSAR